MALWPLFTALNCIPYALYTGGWVYANGYLIAPPRIYKEAISSISSFFHELGSDRLCLWVWMDQTNWPGWAVKRFDFHAETGAYLGCATGAWGVTYINHAALGSYGAIYTTWGSSYAVSEVDADTLVHQSGMWSINPSAWNPSTVFSHAVVNREDGLIAGVGSNRTLQICDIAGVPAQCGALQLPYNLGYLAYESRSICWIITSNGLVGKCNYKMNPPRWEMLSSVQNPAPDAKGYFVAFDSKRNRLAVFRWLPEADDGACRCQIEFYRPLYRIAGLTDPVPVTRLRTGERVRFVAHLYGDSGEGAGTYPVRGEMVAPPAGALLTPITSTEQSGAASLRYQAPEGAATETLSLSATVED